MFSDMIDSYNKLSLKKYNQIMEILKSDEDELDIQVKVLSVLTDIDEEELYNMKLDKYHTYVEGMSFLYEPVKAKKKNLPKTIKINGNEYRLLKNVEDMTAGQYIDIQTYYKQNLGYEYILSTLVIPVDCKKYSDGYIISNVINDIMEMDIQTAVDVCFFFQKKLLNSIRNTLIYLDWMMKGIKIPQKKQEIQKIRTMLEQKISSLNGI